MKFDPQKAYPYPVLRPFSDDFGDVEFQTTVELSLGNEERFLIAKVDFTISSSEIIKKIEDKRAAYFAVFACRNTYFRKSFISTNNMIEAQLELKDLRDEVTVEPYIVAMQDIEISQSPDINSEFGNGPFKYKPGYILAQDEHQSFFIDRDVFKPITSVFDLVKKDTLPLGEWSVDFEQDHVQIAVNPKMKEKIDNARNVIANKAILINSIYFSAVMQAIQNLKEKSGDFESYRWAEVIRRQAHNAGVDIYQCQAFAATEILMKFPLSLLNTYVFKGD